MGFRELAEGISRTTGEYGVPAGASDRYKRLDAYERLLNGSIYEHLAYPFEKEKSGGAGAGGKYIPILERRPSVKYGLAKIVVDQHAAMTFGEAHFPHVRCIQPMQETQSEAQKSTEAACAALIRVMNLPAVMQSALRKGSVGSSALIAKILDDGTPQVDVVCGKNAKPQLNSGNYTKLDALDRIWSLTGEVLNDFGYNISSENRKKDYWLRTYIDKTTWTWFLPLLDEDYRNLGQKDTFGRAIKWQKDKERSGPHGFEGKYAPTIWMRNLMIGDDAIDGHCTFAEIADACIAIDYLLSQGTRGLRYSMDPLLVIKSGEMGAASLDLARASTGTGDISKTSGILPLQGEDADAKLLEITGKGFDASREFVKQLREFCMETSGGLKSDNETSEAGQSGRAIELHYQIVIFFIERLRVCYGDNGLLPLLKILLPALQKGDIDLQDGADWSQIDLKTPLSLVWPNWRKSVGSDLFAEVQAIALAAGSSAKAPVALLHPDILSRILAQELDLDDPAGVAADAKKYREEQEAKQQNQMEQQHQQTMEIASAKSSTADKGAPQHSE
jgi:hypothetical protein